MNKKAFFSLLASTLLFFSVKVVLAGDPELFIETSTGKNSVCAGVNLSLTGHSLENDYTIAEHRWESSTPGIIAATKDQHAFVNTLETGIHIITYSVIDDKGNSFSTQISVRVLELPGNSILVNQKDIIDLNEIHLPAHLSAGEQNYGLKYQWFRDNRKIEGARSSEYKAMEAGSYRLMITSSEGCNSYSPAITIR
jgi:membrane carboxypeptidase/penicillin-binding protein PbpC